jgi:hypothetical protein
VQNRVRAFTQRLLSLGPEVDDSEHLDVGPQAAREAAEVDGTTEKLRIDEQERRATALDAGDYKISGSRHFEADPKARHRFADGRLELSRDQPKRFGRSKYRWLCALHDSRPSHLGGKSHGLVVPGLGVW